MNIIFVLLPLSVFLGMFFLAAYIWSVRNKQFEDLDTPAVRVLTEDFGVKKDINNKLI